MASVYYLHDDALHIADDIVQKYSEQDKYLKSNHLAAIIIQRSYRGYLIRKQYKKTIKAIITLQKHIRGWLVRYHLPDVMLEYIDRIHMEHYTKAATKIQAIWKGILVRREINIKDIMNQKEKSREIVESFNSKSDSQTGNGNAEQIDSDEEEKNMDENSPKNLNKKLVQARILEIMFDRHHLLSTEMHKGVLGANRELKEIEKVLKVLPWKDYISQMGKIYYKYSKMDKERKPNYIFTDKQMQKIEDLFKLRDKSRDLKETNMADCMVDNRPPFELKGKRDSHAYARSFQSEETYAKPITQITRTEDKSKNISKEDFVLTLKKIMKECKVPPYYADFWYQECIGHRFID